MVFDKDDFPENDFNSAILLARRSGFEVAYSNQAFEFWFLLHFNLYQGALHRSRYEKMLSTLLGFAYTKKSGVSSKMFNALFPKQEQAINHAKTIMKQFDGNNPAQQESSTTVYRLVEELNKFVFKLLLSSYAIYMIYFRILFFLLMLNLIERIERQTTKSAPPTLYLMNYDYF